MLITVLFGEVVVFLGSKLFSRISASLRATGYCGNGEFGKVMLEALVSFEFSRYCEAVEASEVIEARMV